MCGAFRGGGGEFGSQGKPVMDPSQLHTHCLMTLQITQRQMFHGLPNKTLDSMVLYLYTYLLEYKKWVVVKHFLCRFAVFAFVGNLPIPKVSTVFAKLAPYPSRLQAETQQLDTDIRKTRQLKEDRLPGK